MPFEGVLLLQLPPVELNPLLKSMALNRFNASTSTSKLPRRANGNRLRAVSSKRVKSGAVMNRSRIPQSVANRAVQPLTAPVATFSVLVLGGEKNRAFGSGPLQVVAFLPVHAT